MVRKPIVLSFCSLFLTVTVHKTKAFLHISDNRPIKTFESDQSGMINEGKTKDCALSRPYSTSMFAPLLVPLKFAAFHNHSALLTMVQRKTSYVDGTAHVQENNARVVAFTIFPPK